MKHQTEAFGGGPAPIWAWLFAIGLSAAGTGPLAVAGEAAADADESAAPDAGEGQYILMEEIVVTGSRLLGLEDSVSPVQIISGEAFNVTPRADLNDFFLVELTANVGLESQIENSGQSGRSRGARGASLNMRNLGEENTLVLINGNRTIEYAAPGNDGWRSVDINGTLPRIAVNRTEVLLDGGSAIYGTDAVAGVVNLIPDYQFKGFKVQADTQFFASALEQQDSTLGLMWGGGGEGANLIAAFELTRKNPPSAVQDSDSNIVFDPQPGDVQFDEAAGNHATTYNGIQVTAPAGRGMGMGMGGGAPVASINSTQFPDPLCGNASALGVEPLYAGITGAPIAVTSRGGGMGMGMGGGAVAPAPSNPMLGVAQDACYHFSNSTGTFDTRSARNTDNIVGLLAIQQDFSEQLAGAAEFSFNNQTLEDFTGYNRATLVNVAGAARLAEGWVIGPDHPALAYYRDNYYELSGAPATAPNPWDNPNGVAPLQYNKQGYLALKPRKHEVEMRRLSASLNYQMNQDWTVQGGFTIASHNVTNWRHDVLNENMRLALQGLGGPNCSGDSPGEGGCEYWNPFMSAALPNADSLGLANSETLSDWILPNARVDFQADFLSFNAAAAGLLPGFKFGGERPIGVALGFEFRQDELAADFDDNYNNAQYPALTGTNAILDYRGKTQVWGAIIDLSLPVTDSFNIQLAGRYENFDSGNGYSQFSPKAGFNWKATGQLTLRGAYNASFKAPTVNHFSFVESLGILSVNLVDPEDPNILNGSAVPGDAYTFSVAELVQPNPNLDPQTADAYSFGFNYRIADSLSLDASFVQIEFRGLIDLLTSRADLLGVLPECYSLEQVADANGVPFNIRQPIDGSATKTCFKLDGAGNPETVFLNYRNLAKRKTQTIDFRLNWSADTGIGRFSLAPGGTWFLKYEQQETEDGEVIDYAGKRLLRGTGPSEWRFNLPISWRMGRHSASLTGRFISALDPLAITDDTILDGNHFATDLRYTLRLRESMTLGLFVTNLFSEIPDNTRGNFPRDRRRIGLQFSWNAARR